MKISGRADSLVGGRSSVCKKANGGLTLGEGTSKKRRTHGGKEKTGLWSLVASGGFQRGEERRDSRLKKPQLQ